MRVTVVTESFHPAGRAWSTSADRATGQLVSHLADAGHAVHLVTAAPGLTSYRHLPITRVDTRDRPGRQVRAALDARQPEVVHVLDPGTLGRKALAHTSTTGVDSLVVQRDHVPGPGWDRWRSRVADRAGNVLFTATWMRDQLAAEGVASGLWLPGVDTDGFSPTLRDDRLHDRWAGRGGRGGGGDVVVGYVGDLRRRHGVRRLAALAAVPGVRVVVVGVGPQRAWLRSRLPRAVFLDPPSTGELAIVLASLDVLVHPGESETCCHTLREAAASGVPVVAPRAGGAPAVVRPLETGLLYDPADRDGLATAVAAIAADPQRAMLGTRGRELARERSWADAVTELTDHVRLPSVA